MKYPEYDKFVVPAYAARYSTMTGVRVTEVVQNVFGGEMIVVRSDEQVDHEEIAYIDTDKTLHIFKTTEELARFIQKLARRSILRRILTTQSLALLAFVIVLLLVVFFAASEFSSADAAIVALGGSLTILAGRLFPEKPAAQA
jgi:hypothetical protein